MGLGQYVRDRAEPCLLWSSAVAIRLASLQACRTQLKSTSSTRSFRDRVRFHQRGSITTAPLTQLCLLPFRLYRSTFHTEDLQLQLNQAPLPLLECSFMIFFYFKTARPLEFAHRLAPCLCHATTDRKVKKAAIYHWSHRIQQELALFSNSHDSIKPNSRSLSNNITAA